MIWILWIAAPPTCTAVAWLILIQAPQALIISEFCSGGTVFAWALTSHESLETVIHFKTQRLRPCFISDGNCRSPGPSDSQSPWMLQRPCRRNVGDLGGTCCGLRHLQRSFVKLSITDGTAGDELFASAAGQAGKRKVQTFSSPDPSGSFLLLLNRLSNASLSGLQGATRVLSPPAQSIYTARK